MRYIKSSIAILLLPLLSACSGKSNYYRLQPTIDNGTKSRAISTKVIGVAEVKVPDYLESKSIVLSSGKNRVNIFETENWAGNPGKNIQSVLRSDLSAILPGYTFVSYPWNEPLMDDNRIYLTITGMDSEKGGVCHIDGRWSLVDEKSGRVVTGREFSYSQKCGDDIDSIASSYSDMIATISRDIAKSIKRNIATGRRR